MQRFGLIRFLHLLGELSKKSPVCHDLGHMIRGVVTFDEAHSSQRTFGIKDEQAVGRARVADESIRFRSGRGHVAQLFPFTTQHSAPTAGGV